ncbi:MAG: DUF3180 domain-containing protein [Stackebrandtia sp.]
MPEDDKPQPSLKPTAPSTLFVAALAAGAIMLLLTTRYYQYIPSPGWYGPASLLALAVVLAFSAHTTRQRVDRAPGAGPVEPLLIARFAALAKASSVGGSLFGGAYAGLVIFLVAQRHLTDAAEDLPKAGFGFVSCLLLVAAALWLERACRIPQKDNESEDSDTSRNAND